MPAAWRITLLDANILAYTASCRTGGILPDDDTCHYMQPGYSWLIDTFDSNCTVIGSFLLCSEYTNSTHGFEITARTSGTGGVEYDCRWWQRYNDGLASTTFWQQQYDVGPDGADCFVSFELTGNPTNAGNIGCYSTAGYPPSGDDYPITLRFEPASAAAVAAARGPTPPPDLDDAFS